VAAHAGAQAAVAQLERRHGVGHERVRLGEEGELADPVGEQDGAVVGLQRDLALLDLARARPPLVEDLGDGAHRLDEQVLPRGRGDPQLQLAHVLVEPVHGAVRTRPAAP
jgi:hypothetical protein